MSTPDDTVSLQDIRTLAHDLYCRCQKELNAFRPISKSIRTLRNRLEEADELLDDGVFRPGDVSVLEAARAGRDVLQQLELTLRNHRSTTKEEDDPDESFIIEFLELVDAVADRLGMAIMSLEEQSGTLKQILDTTTRRRTLSPAVPSSVSSMSVDSRRRHSTVSGVCSPLPDFVSDLDNMSLKSGEARSTVETTTSQHRDPMTGAARVRPLATQVGTSAPVAWRVPYLDPLSLDIDQASHVILAQEATQPSTRVDSGIVYPELQRQPVTPDSDEKPLPGPTRSSTHMHIVTPALGDDTSRLKIRPDCQSYTTEAKGGDCSELDNEHAIISLARNDASQLSAQVARHDLKPLGNRRTGLEFDQSELMDDGGNFSDPIAHDSEASSFVRRPQRYLSSRLGRLQRPPRPPQSRYRIVNPDQSNLPVDDRDQFDANIRDRYVKERQGLPSAPYIKVHSVEITMKADDTDKRDHKGHLRVQTPPEAKVVAPVSFSTGTVQSPMRGLGITTSNEDNSVRATDIEEVIREHAIVSNWNEHKWEEAQALLQHHVSRLTKLTEHQTARRLRYLLGVLASLKGDWSRVVTSLLSVLSAPITPSSQLDDGDYAACYWLGDVYALLNRRVEALLAYSIAERSPLYQDAARPGLLPHIRVEQEACREGIDTIMHRQDSTAIDSIMNVRFVTPDAASFFLSYVRRQLSSQHTSYVPNNNDSRSVALWKLRLGSEVKSEKERMHIDVSAFDTSSAWPLTFDPLYNTANVSQGRLVSHECDLLELAHVLKIAKASRIGRGRSDCFTHHNLPWVVKTLRRGLKHLRMEWSEHHDSQSTWFAVRYMSTEDGISTHKYFSVSIFNLTFRTGFGVDICPTGIFSARIVRTGPNFERGVHKDEAKSMRVAVRQYLDAAARQYKLPATRDTALPVTGINGDPDRDSSVRRGAVRYA